MVSLFNSLSHCGFQILAFPCNQFGWQEPSSNADIEKFAQSQGVKFEMMAKSKVNGPETNEVWKFLKHQFPGEVQWNFDTKFFVDRNGTVVARYDGKMTPQLEPKVRALVCTPGIPECC